MSETHSTAVLNQNEKFIKKTFNVALIPCMLAMLSANINVIVDGILVGNMIGEDALAAINLSLPLYWALCVVGSFLGYGSSTPASIAMGGDNKVEYTAYYRTGTTLLIIAGVVVTILGLIFINPIDNILCNDEAIRPYVHEYVFITILGALPKLLIYIPYGYLRLDGRNVEVMAIMIIMATVNVVLDVIFVYFLDMGVFGAGLASVIATTIVCVLGFIWLYDNKSSFKYKPFISKNPFILKNIVKSGAPFGLNNLFSTLRVLMVNTIFLSMGGGVMVASLTAINGISGFAETITLGVPQASTAILGICQGEEDNPSMVLLFKRMIKTGFICIFVFGAIILFSSDFISKIYNLDSDLHFPLFMMVLGLFPCLFFNSLQSFYNVSQKETWSNFLIILRQIVMVWLSLFICDKLNISPWPFLFLSEAFSFILWIIAVFIKKALGSSESTFLFINAKAYQEGKFLNFSVNDTSEEICEASEKISNFCSENGMTTKETLRLSMSIEEILQMVKDENPNQNLSFDLRAFCYKGIMGIRFRYGGKDFNPFVIPEEDPENRYLGIKMIENLVTIAHHYRTFGTNTVLVILSDGDDSSFIQERYGKELSN